MSTTPARLSALAARDGTPLFVYALETLRARLGLARASLEPGTRLLYAMKANPHPALLRALVPLMDGVDVASLGELQQARAAGASLVSLAGPGKTDAALAAGADVVVVESIAELGRVAPGAAVLVRLNPRRRVRAFAVSTTGGPSPFGVDEEDLPALASAIHTARDARGLRYLGIHVHAGSQCASARAYLEHISEVLELGARLAVDHELPPAHVCFGGGWGVAQDDHGHDLDLSVLSAGLTQSLDRWARHTGAPRPVPSFELGRWLVAEAGTYVATVIATKVSRGVTFVILDGGLNHLLAATDAFGRERPHPPLENLTRPEAPRTRVTVVGPLCTPLDVLGRDVELPRPEPGDRLAFRRVGAYGLSFSPSAFLGHPQPAERLDEGHDVLAEA